MIRTVLHVYQRGLTCNLPGSFLKVTCNDLFRSACPSVLPIWFIALPSTFSLSMSKDILSTAQLYELLPLKCFRIQKMSTTVKSNVHVPVVFIIGYDPGLGGGGWGGGGNLYDGLHGQALSLREDWLTVLYELSGFSQISRQAFRPKSGCPNCAIGPL